ncbi:MAG TPA: hypothetical protein VLU46_01825, partial [Thermoanaerobaculia bacterium]|nr:hypothetical protein [Thermoanaerobaculia bacterium]
ASIDLPTLQRDPDLVAHSEFAKLYDQSRFADALALADRTHFAPVNSIELARLAELMASAGREEAAALAEKLRPLEATEADAIVAKLRLRQGRDAEAMAALERAFIRYRSDPWPDSDIMGHALDTALTLVRSDKRFAPRVYELLSVPFTTGQWTDAEKIYRIHVAHAAWGCGVQTIAALHAMEPNFPWASDLLAVRRKCYRGDEQRNAERDWRAITPRSLSGSFSGR